MEESNSKGPRIISRDTILHTKWEHQDREIDPEAWRIYITHLKRELKSRGLWPSSPA